MPIELPRLLAPEVLLARHPGLAPRALQAGTSQAGWTDVLIVDLCNAQNYATGHVPDAVHVEPADIVAGTRPAVGKLPSTERLAALVSELGLTPDTWVIAYDDEGGGWAGRFLWTLEMIGHTRWSYLDGGLPAWVDIGAPLSTVIPTRTRTRYPIAIQTQPRVLIDELVQRYRDPGVRVWDARSASEHRGERTGSARAGRIPGAINLDWLEVMDPARALRLRTDLPTLLAARGLASDHEIITHCQTHHRSGLTWLVGRLLNLNIRAYDGSWSEWGNREDTPIESGPPSASGTASATEK